MVKIQNVEAELVGSSGLTCSLVPIITQLRLQAEAAPRPFPCHFPSPGQDLPGPASAGTTQLELWPHLCSKHFWGYTFQLEFYFKSRWLGEVWKEEILLTTDLSQPAI